MMHTLTLLIGLIIARPLQPSSSRSLATMAPNRDVTISFIYPIFRSVLPSMLWVFGAVTLTSLRETTVERIKRMVERFASTTAVITAVAKAGKP